MTENERTKLHDIILKSNKIVFFGGAGVSTESGIPDFRSKDGLYNQKDVNFENYSPEYLLSHSCLFNDSKVFYEFYKQELDTRHCSPNTTHKVLARMEKMGKLSAIVTQNIDNLHQRAGSEKVYEIHGSTARNYCAKCGMTYHSDFIFNTKEKIPKCECRGLIRPDVTLYEECLPAVPVANALNAIGEADCLIVGGTSLEVYPANSFVYSFAGEHLVIINRDHLDVAFNKENDLQINENLGDVFTEINKILDEIEEK